MIISTKSVNCWSCSDTANWWPNLLVCKISENSFVLMSIHWKALTLPTLPWSYKFQLFKCNRKSCYLSLSFSQGDYCVFKLLSTTVIIVNKLFDIAFNISIAIQPAHLHDFREFLCSNVNPLEVSILSPFPWSYNLLYLSLFLAGWLQSVYKLFINNWHHSVKETELTDILNQLLNCWECCSK